MNTKSLPKKVLIINTFGIGDVLFTTPLVRNIKAGSPETHIGYIANKRTLPILENNPYIDRVFVYERDDFNKAYKKSKRLFFKRARELLADIKKEKYDCVIDLSMHGANSFLMWAIGIKQRVGFNYKKRSPFLTAKIPLQGYESKHVAEYYLDILRIFGWPAEHKNLQIFVPGEDQNWAQNLLNENMLADKSPVVGIFPGGGASWGKDAVYKRWPAEKFAKIADKLIEKYSAAIILMGDEKERSLCEKVADLMQNTPVQVCGSTSLGQSAALLSKCNAVLVNDGGPLHVAVAAGVRSVSIFGPVDDRVYGPFPSENHKVVKRDLACRPCYRNFRRAQCDHISCLSTIDVEDVFKQFAGVL